MRHVKCIASRHIIDGCVTLLLLVVSKCVRSEALQGYSLPPIVGLKKVVFSSSTQEGVTHLSLISRQLASAPMVWTRNQLLYYALMVKESEHSKPTLDYHQKRFRFISWNFEVPDHDLRAKSIKFTLIANVSNFIDFSYAMSFSITWCISYKIVKISLGMLKLYGHQNLFVQKSMLCCELTPHTVMC